MSGKSTQKLSVRGTQVARSGTTAAVERGARRLSAAVAVESRSSQLRWNEIPLFPPKYWLPNEDWPWGKLSKATLWVAGIGVFANIVPLFTK